MQNRIPIAEFVKKSKLFITPFIFTLLKHLPFLEKKESLNVLKEYLENVDDPDFNINCHDPIEDDTPLHAVLRQRVSRLEYSVYLDQLKLLLKHNADPNGYNRVLKKNVLHFSMENKLWDAVETLIEAKANLSDKVGKPTLCYDKILNEAIIAKNPNLVKQLLFAKANPNNNHSESLPLNQVMSLKDPVDREIVNEMVTLLLAAKADPNKKKAHNYDDTALGAAVRTGNMDGMRCLITAKANLEEVGDPYLNETPLSIAVQVGSSESVQLLLDAKADPNTFTGYFQESVLTMTPCTEILKTLIKYNADVNKKDLSREKTPVLIKVITRALPNLLANVQLLLAAKADPRQPRLSEGTLPETALDIVEAHLSSSCLSVPVNVNELKASKEICAELKKLLKESTPDCYDKIFAFFKHNNQEKNIIQQLSKQTKPSSPNKG